MERLIVFIIILLVSQNYIFIEEETLIIASSVIWLDAAGGVFKKVIGSELEERGNKVKEKFEWYLKAKEELIKGLITKRRLEGTICKEIKETNSNYIKDIIQISVRDLIENRVIENRSKIIRRIEIGGYKVLNKKKIEEIKGILKEIEKIT